MVNNYKTSDVKNLYKQDGVENNKQNVNDYLKSGSTVIDKKSQSKDSQN